MHLYNSGLFVTIDGPNAVGKGTFIDKLAEKMSIQQEVYSTKEPTLTRLGKFAKTNEGELTGLPYAYLIAADRCLHIESEIKPRLKDGEIVISDRYVESSFVYQKYDGVSYDEIWNLNAHFLIPDLSILLIADSEVISRRLSERSEFSEYEKKMTRLDELAFYRDAKQFLSKKGYRYLELANNTIDELEANIQIACSEITSLLRGSING